jgi:hypothetical protein
MEAPKNSTCNQPPCPIPFRASALPKRISCLHSQGLQNVCVGQCNWQRRVRQAKEVAGRRNGGGGAKEGGPQKRAAGGGRPGTARGNADRKLDRRSTVRRHPESSLCALGCLSVLPIALQPAKNIDQTQRKGWGGVRTSTRKDSWLTTCQSSTRQPSCHTCLPHPPIHPFAPTAPPSRLKGRQHITHAPPTNTTHPPNHCLTLSRTHLLAQVEGEVAVFDHVHDLALHGNKEQDEPAGR